jgi:hypothetical protein
MHFGPHGQTFKRGGNFGHWTPHFNDEPGMKKWGDSAIAVRNLEFQNRVITLTIMLGGLVLIALGPWAALNVTWDSTFASGVTISQSGTITKSSGTSGFNAGAYGSLAITSAPSASLAFRFTIAKATDALSAGFTSEYTSDLTRLSSAHVLAGFDFGATTQRVSLFHSGNTRSNRAGYQAGDVFDLVLTAQGSIEYRRCALSLTNILFPFHKLW